VRILVTGHDGYIGSVLVPMLEGEGHEVVGLDTFWFEGCDFGDARAAPVSLRADLRDITLSDLEGFDAVIHLAALSNDPMGDLNTELTYEVNHKASVRLGVLAKEAGVERFVFSSSCSLYGAAADDLLTEDAPFNPITAYAVSKVRVEEELAALESDNFSPVFLRNATVYGVSPRLRTDLVVNNLVGYAVTTGEVHIQSDGTPWRPLAHVKDVCRAFGAVLKAPREVIHNQAFNVGRNEDNVQIKDIADIVEDVVPGSRITYAGGASPDARCYRVDCRKLSRLVPDAAPQWTLRRGIESLYEAYAREGMTSDEFNYRYVRMKHIRNLMDTGALDSSLRWTEGSGVARGEVA
jgi:nucleoside-diphosphate-sugar epimerase